MILRCLIDFAFLHGFSPPLGGDTASIQVVRHKPLTVWDSLRWVQVDAIVLEIPIEASFTMAVFFVSLMVGGACMMSLNEGS